MVLQPLLLAALLASLLAGCSASNDALDARLARDELALEQQFEALEERAREGDAAAAYELAARFYDGRGVEGGGHALGCETKVRGTPSRDDGREAMEAVRRQPQDVAAI